MMHDGTYQAAFNATPVGELLVAPNPAFTILAVNDSLLRLSGRQREDLIGKGILDAFPGDPSDTEDSGVHSLHASLGRALASGQPDEMPLQRYPIEVPMPDGSQRYEERFWSARNTPVFDANGNLVCISHRTIDVTEQKRESDAAAFRAAREKFQLALADRIRPLTDPDAVTAAACELLGKLLDAGRVLFGEVDESGEFMDLSRDWTSGGMHSMAGRRLTLLEFGGPVIEAVRAGQVIVVEDVLTDARCAPFADAYLSKGVRSFLGIPLIKQGRLRATLNVHNPATHRWTDLEIAIADDLVDRTWSAVENARAQEKLRIERDRSQAVFETMTEGFGMLDRDWTVLYMNAEGLRIGDRVGQQVVGRNHWDIWPEYVGSELELLYQRVMQTRQAGTLETRHAYSDGRVVWLEVRAYPGADGGLSVFFRDVTGRKEAEEQLKDADRRKDEFLAMLAHELRNPLAPIGAAAELLQMIKLDEQRVRTTSAVIGRQVRHMTGLIDDLLDVSRVTRGLIELDKAALDIQHVLNEAVEQVSPLIRSRGHALMVLLAPQSALVWGDKKRLVQVVANLLNNAAKYTPEGGHLALHTSVHDEAVLIDVNDDGIGMTPETARRAFDLFSQAERSSDRSSGGLGLGLALVKSLVELHGGTVTCNSEGLGKGSSFSICLPRLREPARQAPHVAGRSDEPSLPALPLKILVVDDNVDAAEMLKLFLEAMGHEVMVEYRPLQALEQAKRYRPDVCLVDIGLPEIDGNEVARRLRAQPENAAAVLVAVTGYGQDSDRASTLAAGFDHHLVKPVNTAALSAILSTVRRH